MVDSIGSGIGSGAIAGGSAGMAFGPVGGLVGSGVGAAIGGIGAYMGMQAAQGQSQAQQNIAALQMQVQKKNEDQMNLTARRAQLEVVRNNQRARAQAMNNAVGSGSQFGSGLAGGLGQIAGMSGNNLLGLNQNLMIGRQIATLNQGISQQEMLYAKYQGSAATASGVSQIGQGLFSLGQSVTSASINPSQRQQGYGNY